MQRLPGTRFKGHPFLLGSLMHTNIIGKGWTFLSGLYMDFVFNFMGPGEVMVCDSSGWSSAAKCALDMCL